MNTNPQTTPAIYPNYNAGDFPAAYFDADEAVFDAQLEQLRLDAEAERRDEQQARKAEKLAAGEKWLQQYPLLNNMLAGGIISPDSGTNSTMQPSYENRGVNLYDNPPVDDELLNAALGLSYPSGIYEDHPEQSKFTEWNRVEKNADEAQAATVSKLASPAEQVEYPPIQEALEIGVDINTLRKLAENKYPPDNYTQDKFRLAA